MSSAYLKILKYGEMMGNGQCNVFVFEEMVQIGE